VIFKRKTRHFSNWLYKTFIVSKNSQAKFQLVLLVTFVVFGLLLFITSLNHESWFDEAQAWLIARDSRLLEMLWVRLRYEGHPSLWYLVLYTLTRLNFPYVYLSFVSSFFIFAAVYIFLRYSPFPLIIKLLLPFTYFFSYQYSVVARNYCLFTLFIFLVAHFFKNRFNKPLLYFVALILLSHTSVHGMLFSFVFIARFCISLYRNKIERDVIKRKYFPILFICFLNFFFLVFQLFPNSDVIFIESYSISFRKIAQIYNSFLIGTFGESFYLFIALFLTSLFLFKYLKILNTYFITMALFLLFFITVYSNVWHQGIVFLIFFSITWMGLSTSEIKLVEKKGFYYLWLTLVVLLLFVHITWSVNTIKFDMFHNYSSSYAVSEYIKENKLEDKIIYTRGFFSMGVLPYFERNIYDNYNNKQNPSYWFWSSKNSIVLRAFDIEDSPEYILYGIKFIEIKEAPDLEGYIKIAAFEGDIYWKYRVFEHESYVLYQREYLKGIDT